MVFRCFTNTFPKPLQVWSRFGHTDTRCFCAYQTYHLEDSFGDKASQSGIMMQFGVNLSRCTSAVCGITPKL